jgi:transcriptional regulator GlxA family with amidase domain
MSKHVSILVPAGELTLIDIIASYKAFKRVNHHLEVNGKDPLFTVQLVGTAKDQDLEDGLFSVHPHAHIKEVKRTDLIIIPAISWDFQQSIAANLDLIPWIIDQYRKGAEIASMCVGGVLLASTGLLNGRSCSTHWMAADNFRKMFPEVKLVTEKIITDEHGIYTNGGAFSFVNLLLYLIEKYCGREMAIFCAKVFEVDIDRNSQSVFTMFSGLKDHQDEDIKQAQLFIETHLAEKISMEALASRLGIGRRNFDRRFIRATFNTPMEYLQRVKIEAAKKALETSRLTINEVMYSVGYSNLKAFRKVFKKLTGVSPIDYRNKYNKEAVEW